LVVTLMMLVVVLVLGVTALRLATTEERMTAYALDRQLAFQAAEAGLREIEGRVESDRPTAGTACTPAASATTGALRTCPAPAAGDAPRWITLDTRLWSEATPVGPAGAQITPTYLIEDLGDQFACPAAAVAASNCRQYRITVRAGGGPRAEVMLQSLYLTD
jgi:type IV pilus assembly protein PilX